MLQSVPRLLPVLPLWLSLPAILSGVLLLSGASEFFVWVIHTRRWHNLRPFWARHTDHQLLSAVQRFSRWTQAQFPLNLRTLFHSTEENFFGKR